MISSLRDKLDVSSQQLYDQVSCFVGFILHKLHRRIHSCDEYFN